MALSTRLADIRAAQLERLRAGIESLLQTNRFYQARLHRVGTWDDFERLPLTTKDEITADQQAHPPFGTDITFPIDPYTRLHQTFSMNSTTPLRLLYTPDSSNWSTR